MHDRPVQHSESTAQIPKRSVQALPLLLALLVLDVPDVPLVPEAPELVLPLDPVPLLHRKFLHGAVQH